MSLLHKAVLRTKDAPGLSSVYRGAYRTASAAAARALAALKGVETVYLHRGLTAEGWTPGVSDIDLILVRREFAGAEEEAGFLESLDRRLGALKKVFPMLGDIWLSTGPELDDYLRWGGLRAWDDPPRWRLAAGAPRVPAANLESPDKRRRLDPWVWALVSHMEISRRLFCPSGLAEKEDADLRKLFLDFHRFADAAGSADGRPRPRAEEARRRPQAARRPALELWLESALSLERRSRAVLETFSGREISRTAFSEGDPPAGLEALRREAGARACVLDLPYHLYLLLDPGRGENAYARAAGALLAAPPAAVPLVLAPEAWTLLLQSSYLGAPLGILGAALEPRPALESRGAVFAGALPEPVPLLPAALRREVAAEAASWMALWWRPLWISRAHPGDWKIRHLRTRAGFLIGELGGRAPEKTGEPPFLEIRRFQAALAEILRRRVKK